MADSESRFGRRANWLATRLSWMSAGIVAASIFSSVTCEAPSSSAGSPFFLIDHLEEAQTSFNEKQFRSFRKDGKLADRITLGEETRLALIPPLPSQISFDLEIPSDPILRFAIAVASLGARALPAPVDFRLLVDAGTGEEVCFEGTVRRAKPNRWLDHEVDLSPWAGTRVRLTLETRRGVGGASSDHLPILPLWGSPVIASRGARSHPPNLILISVDCLRADHLGVYGYERDTSPRIDEFAKQGVVFETAVSTSAYTLPTHMAMLTGLPPSLHGATRWRRLVSSVPYLPELLARSGYRVDGVVSGAYLSQNFGFERGFHTYRYIHDPGAARLVDEALSMVHQAEGQSHFLFLHLFDPHWRYLPPPEFRARFGPRPPDISGLLAKVPRGTAPTSEEEINQMMNLYDGEIAYVDQELGRLFDELKAAGLYERSLIILTADHGEAFYEHRYWEHSQTLYEEMVRIPMIVKWPAESLTASVATLVSQADVFPTMLEAAGVKPPKTWAVSLRRHLDGTAPPVDSRKAIMEITWDPRPTRGAIMRIALRSQEFKYTARITAPTVEELYDGEIKEEELYDLRSDPGEQNNLLPASHPLSRSFRKEMLAYLRQARELRTVRAGEDVVLDETIRERLRTLGYIDQ